MTEPVVLESQRGATAVLMLNRPAASNAVNAEMSRLLGDAISRADDAPDVRAIVITGAGDRVFCAGADLKDVAAGRPVIAPDRAQWGFAGLVRRFVDTPLIAAVNGAAHGGGFEIALACDLVVAVRTASFVLPEGRRGVIAGGGGTTRLPQQLPLKLAMQALLTGSPLSAELLAHHGFVNYLVEPGEALDRALVVAEQIAAFSPSAIRGTKRAALGAVADTVPREAEAWAVSDGEVFTNRRTADFREGTRAFAEKRDPVWTGR
jgi:crotonobetainyl-CoA hydratase